MESKGGPEHLDSRGHRRTTAAELLGWTVVLDEPAETLDNCESRTNHPGLDRLRLVAAIVPKVSG